MPTASLLSHNYTASMLMLMMPARFRTTPRGGAEGRMAGSILLLLGVLVMLMQQVGRAHAHAQHDKRTQSGGIFIFGDSYADTGNHDPSDPALSSSWRYPYGTTWPGIPAGRFSDGRCITDFFAEHLGVINPIPYRAVSLSTAYGPNSMVASVNFAFGGSGVFPTFGPAYPNISTQINQFKELLQKKLISTALIKSSIVLLVIAGNDYTAYSNQHPNNQQGVRSFSAKVVGQMKTDLEELHALGLRRFAVTNIEPFGCFPQATRPLNYTRCDPTKPTASDFHNKFLKAAISSLQSTLPDTQFTILDLHSAFGQILQGNSTNLIVARQPCCEVTGTTGSCGAVGGDGQALYTLCSTPKEHFFWDGVHPTDHAWKLVSKILFR